MGVHGLWKLLEASGKPVPLESLDNKVLAVDVSIWLHQLVKGFQDSRGSPLPNAHLLGLFHRVCKLLFYRIKPVFVFDGGVPLLKKQTIATRKKLKSQASEDASRLREQLLRNLIKRKAVRRVLQGKESTDKTTVEHHQQAADIFHLPPAVSQETEKYECESEEGSLAIHQPLIYSSDSDSDSEHELKISPQKLQKLKLDLHSLDVTSEEFLSLPPDVRHDILSELQETRKQNSWGRLHEMPEESNDFSSFQLGRLIKRRNVQVSLEQAEKEMGGKVLSLNELQELMSAQGVNIVTDETSKIMDSASRKIASDAATRYLLLKESSVKEGSSTNQKRSETELVQNSVLHTTKSISEDIDDPQAIYDDSWSSDEEVMQDRVSDALQKALESGDDDLSQEQILALIQSGGTTQRDKSVDTEIGVPSTSTTIIHKPEVNSISTKKRKEEDLLDKLSSVSEDKSDFSRLSECINIDENTLKSEVSPEKCHSDVVKDSKSHRAPEDPPCTPQIRGGSNEIRQYNADSSIAIVCVEKPQNSFTIAKDTKHSIVDSDSDDFQEVTGQTKKLTGSDSEMYLQQTKDELPIKTDHLSIEIIINPEDKPTEDDIFADIFSSPASLITQDSPKVTLLQHAERENTFPTSGNIGASDTQEPDGAPDVIVSRIEHLQKTDSEDISKLNDNDSSRNIAADAHQNAPSVCEILESSKQSSNQESVKHDENVNYPFVEPLSPSELQSLEASLEEEERGLQTEKGRQERLAASITEQMCQEAQELLELFGLPYIVAPLEAEAQCAFLDAISLTEGTITDDSDIWLFGGKKVYKNFFNQKKHVLQYTYTNIQHYFKLTREQLIQLALLVGSDYTVGLQGIGPVTALEIIAAFCTNIDAGSIEGLISGLKQFKNWCKGDSSLQSPQKQRLKKKLKNVKVVDGFPNQAVVEAYLRPTVDDSRETFSWGALDLPALRDYARSKFGWPASKTDEILLPVSKRWSLRTSQRSIDSYFNLQPKLVQGLNKMSKRVQKAVNTLSAQDGGESSSEDVDDDLESHASNTQTLPKAVNKRGKRVGIPSQKDQNINSSKQIHKDLPVRAPTVPRNRTRQGIKRVGVKSTTNRELKTTVAPLNECESEQSSNSQSQSAPSLDVDDEQSQPYDSGKPQKRKLSELSHNATKRGKRTAVNNSQSEDHKRNNNSKEEMKDLPIRAPTVPRKRTSQGIKRIGKKPNNKSDMKPSHMDTDVGEQNTQSSKTIPVARKTTSLSKKLCEVDQESSLHPPTITADTVARRSQESPSKNLATLNRDCGTEVFDPVPSTSGVVGTKCSSSNLSSCGKEGASGASVRRPSQERFVDHEMSDSETSDEGCLYNNSHVESSTSFDKDCQDYAAVELEAVSSLDWQMDPWEDTSSKSSKRPRQKLYFGGIRPNRTVKKPSRPPDPTPPASGSDSRGMRPGWRTEQQLQSRDTVWMESLQTQKEDVIPQRERDRRALEQAKIRAIQYMKASDSQQASRILGGVSKSVKRTRGRAKTKPTRKELPEHNLSESSSDE